MYLYEMNWKQADTIRWELNLNNAQGTFYKIVGYIKEELGEDGNQFRLDQCDLQQLGSSLDLLKGGITYHDDFVQTVFKEDWNVYFDFDRDVCNIRDLVMQNIRLSTLRETGEPVLTVDIDVIVGVLKYEVFKYLNKKETKNDESREEKVD